MSELAAKPHLFERPAQTATAPERAPRKAPVFIADAVTPFGGETLLLSLLRAQAWRDEDQP